VGVAVSVPIRLRLEPTAVSAHDQIDEAIEAALGRALRHSCDVAWIGPRPPITVERPTVTWHGRDLARLAPSVRASESDRLIEVIDSLARALLAAPGLSGGRGALLPAPSSERGEAVDPVRLEAYGRSYVIPGYQRHGASVDVPIESGSDPFAKPDLRKLPRKTPPRPIDIDSVAKRLESTDAVTRAIALLEVLPWLERWDRVAFVLTLAAIRGDDESPTGAAIQALRDLARRDPGRFRSYLRQWLEAAAPLYRGAVFRDDAMLQTFQRLRPRLDIAAAIVRVVAEVPQARPLAREWESRMPGASRLIGLVNGVVEALRDLNAQLAKSPWPLGAKLTGPLATMALRFGRTSGLAALMAIDRDETLDVHALQEDVLEAHRWVDHTREVIDELEGRLSVYRLLFGDQATTREEVQELLDTRARLLQALIDNPLPPAARTRTLVEAGDTDIADWPGRAADRKIPKIESALAKVEPIVPQGDSAYYGYYRVIDAPWNTRAAEARQTLRVVKERLAAGQAATSDAVGVSGQARLSALVEAENAIPTLALRASALQLWRGTLRLLEPISHDDVGSSSEQSDWRKRIFALVDEYQALHDHPDFSDIEWRFQKWQWAVEGIAAEIKSAARRELAIDLGISLVAMVVTFGVGAYLTGARVGIVAVTFAEAGTFTAVSTLGRALILDKSVDPGGVAVEFATNTAFVGVMKVLGAGLSGAARRLFPDRAVAQLAFVLGTQTVVVTFSGPVMTLLATGRFPENMDIIVVGNLLLSAVAAGLSGPKMLKTLRAQNRADLVAEVVALQREGEQIRAANREMWESGAATPENSDILKGRAASLFDRLNKVLGRMLASDVSDAALRDLGLTRAKAQQLLDLSRTWADILRGTDFRPPSGLAALPAPTEVLGTGSVRVAGGNFEYNSALRGFDPATLTKRLQGAGYTVVDRGGGVLELRAPGDDGRAIRLLPTRADVAAPALRSLVRPGEIRVPQGIQVLQAQMAVPPLEAAITSLAANDPAIARLIIAGIGRHLKPEHVRELQGAARFLEIGGSPRTLAVALGVPDKHDSSSVRTTLERFNGLTPQEATSVDALIQLRGTGRHATDAIVGIGSRFDPPGSYYLTVAELRPVSESGLSHVVGGLASFEANLNQGASGVLRAARKLLADHPGARLRFEVIMTSEGQVVRITDILAELPAEDPLGHIRGEVKEADTVVLQFGRSASQFRHDVLLELRHPTPAPGHPLSRIRWYVRHPKGPDGQFLTGDALKAVHDRIKAILMRAFDGGALVNHPRRAELIDAYSNHFDEIVRFF
jgi:hypothetical protein